MKVSLLISALTLTLGGTFAACSTDEDIINEQQNESTNKKIHEQGKMVAIDNKDAVISMFKDHYSLSRTLHEGSDLFSSYNMDEVTKIVSADNSLSIYVLPSYDEKNALIGYPSVDGKELTYILKVQTVAENTFRLCNEIGEPILDITYNTDKDIFIASNVYDNDVIPMSRISAPSFICNVGMAALGEACAGAAALTGGTAIIFAVCWAAATYIACP